MVAFGRQYRGSGNRRNPQEGAPTRADKGLLSDGTYACQYDQEGNRIPTSTVAQKTQYTYDYFDYQPCPSDDIAGGTSAYRYLEAEAVEQVLATDDGDVLWGLPDHEGTIREVVNICEALMNHVEHVGFGAPTAGAEILMVWAGNKPIDRADAAAALSSSALVCIMEAFDLWSSVC